MGTENVRLGPCDVTYNSVNLGLTKGGVTLELETETYEVKVDQYGESAISEVITARNVTVTVPMAETTLDNLVLVMPGATKVGTGANSRVDIKSAVGTNLLASAQELKLHPRDMGTSEELDVVIPQASTGGNISFSYNANEERVYQVTFKGYVNAATDHLLSIGDPDAS